MPDKIEPFYMDAKVLDSNQLYHLKNKLWNDGIKIRELEEDTGPGWVYFAPDTTGEPIDNLDALRIMVWRAFEGFCFGSRRLNHFDGLPVTMTMREWGAP